MARVLLSWIPHNPYNTIIQAIYNLTDPMLKPFRNMVPVSGLDLAPLFAFIALSIVKQIVFRLLF